MYCIFYKLIDKPVYEEEFMREIDMESHYNIWLDDDALEKIEFLHFYKDNKEYTPAWV